MIFGCAFAQAQAGDTVVVDGRKAKLLSGNLIPNPGFEEGFAGWTSGAAAAEITAADFTLSSGDGVDASTCLYSLTSAGVGSAASIATGWAIGQGKTYYFSFCVKHQSAAAAEEANAQYLKVSLTNSKTNTDEPVLVLNGCKVGANGEWTKNEALFANSGGYGYVVARFRWLGSLFAFDNFALYEAAELPNHEALQAVVGEAQLIYDAATPGAAALQAAIGAAQRFLAVESPSDVRSAIAELQAAIAAYRYANASPTNPLDVTDFIVNPSFEEGFTGWTNAGMSAQTNAVFSLKDGAAYAERWVNRGSRVSDAGVQQVLTGIPNGRYRLTAGALNVQQAASGSVANSSASPQTGAFLFAGHESVAVDTLKNRSVDFIVLDSQVTLGFKAEDAGGNWIACDNFRLRYLGFDMAAVRGALQELVDSAAAVGGQDMDSGLREALLAAIGTANSASTVAEIAAADRQLRAAIAAARISIELHILADRVANGTGVAPVVVTHPLHARGATAAFGRSAIAGAAASDLLEHGFCWSEQPEPTIFDSRTTKSFSSNGYIYRIENLTPATVYYMRAYAITNTYAVGYGDVIKVVTIPKGTVTFQLGSSVTSAEGHHERIKAAMESAVGYFNNLTSIQNHRLSVSYSSGTPTAEASYGGYMQFGAGAGYQQTGTALHEMGHTIGVGQHSLWYGPNSPLRETGESGRWLGERAGNIVKFIDNDSAGYLRGDKVHMWPYGINGAHEDDGSELLYTANALIVQGLGEDGLPPTGGFATPSYTFLHNDALKYYIRSEAQPEAFLVASASGNLVVRAVGGSAAVGDSAAWHIRFNPATCYYQIRNAATGLYFTYQAGGANGIALTATPTSFQLMGSRGIAGLDTAGTPLKSYWIVRPEAKLNPPCLAAGASGATAAAAFDFTDAATAQRWLIVAGGKAAEAADSGLHSPALTATPLSSSWVRLAWSAAAGAGAYRIYRAMYPDSAYSLIADLYPHTGYDDSTGLKPNTIYWYKVHSVSSGGESANATPVRVITKKADGADGDGSGSGDDGDGDDNDNDNDDYDDGDSGDGLTGIADAEAGKDLLLLHNPVKAGGALNLRWSRNAAYGQACSVEIFDVAGKKVRRQSAGAPLYAPNAPGVYFVRVTAPAFRRTVKLLVN